MTAVKTPIICSDMTLMKTLFGNMNSKSGKKPLLKSAKRNTKNAMNKRRDGKH
jgi:hypothetical protein